MFAIFGAGCYYVSRINKQRKAAEAKKASQEKAAAKNMKIAAAQKEKQMAQARAQKKQPVAVENANNDVYVGSAVESKVNIELKKIAIAPNANSQALAGYQATNSARV